VTSPSTANVHTYTHIHTYKIAHTHTFKYTYFHAQHTHSPSSACLACCWLHLNYLTCTHKTHTHAVHQAPVWPAAGCTSILSLAHTKHTHTQSIKRLSGLLLAAPQFSHLYTQTHTRSPSSACLACCWLHLNSLTCTHKAHTHAVHQAPVWLAADCT